MQQKNNLNFVIENDNLVFSNKVSKTSLIVATVIELILFAFIFLPILLLSSWLIGIILLGSLSFVNLFFMINWSFIDSSVYETIFNLFRFKSQFQKIKSKQLIKSEIIYENSNTIGFVFEKNKLVLKSYFEIGMKELNGEAEFEQAVKEFEILLQENNLKFFSIGSNFSVKENLNKFSKLIDEHINFSKENILNNSTNKLLIQQYANFILLDQPASANNVNIVEFSREFAVDASVKVDWNSSYYQQILSNFRIEEQAFRTSIHQNNLITIKLLNDEYLSSVKNNILLFNENDEFIFSPRFFINKNTPQNNKKYFRFLKVSELNPLLDVHYLFEIINNPFNYDVSFNVQTLNDLEEAKIINYLEQATSSNSSYKYKKLHRKSSVLKREIIQEILTEQIIEMESQNLKSKAISILVRVEGNSVKELFKNIKEFKAIYRKRRIKFKELLFLQKEAFLDHHLGLENRIKKNGKEKKYRFKARKFNNLNCNSLWLTTESVAYSLPFKEIIDIEPSGWIYGDDLVGNPIAIDFDLNRPNKHISILGKSGSGKTTAAEYLLNQKLIDIDDDKKSVVIIFDPKNEYADFVNENGGQVFNIAKGFANPFKRNAKEISEDDKENVELLLTNLIGSLEIDKNSTVVRILELIFDSKEWKENKYDFDVLTKNISSSKTLKEKLGQKDHLLLVDFFKQYSSIGTKSHLFNQKINLDISKKIISFNFSKLISSGTNNDIDTLIFVVLNYLNNLMKQNDSKLNFKHKHSISILIDEFHLFLNSQNNAIIKQFDMLYAISRSYGVGIISISQNLETLNNPNIAHYSRSIFANTAYFIIFQQDARQFEHLTHLLPEQIVISEVEKENILSSAIKHQSLIIYNNQKKYMKWKLGLFYDKTRDENTDGLRDIRINECENLFAICQEYVNLEKANLEKE